MVSKVNIWILYLKVSLIVHRGDYNINDIYRDFDISENEGTTLEFIKSMIDNLENGSTKRLMLNEYNKLFL